MNFQERYDAIINYIEENLEKKTSEVVKNLSNRLQINSRMLGEGFLFVTGLSINEYVRSRRVINSLQYRLDTGCSIDTAAEMYGFPDQPTLSKACKEALQLSPSQVTEEMLRDCPPLNLQKLLMSGNAEMLIPAKKTAKINAFGTSWSQFSEIRKYSEMNSLYGLDDEHVEMVYKIHQEYDVDLDDIFEFVEGIEVSKEILKTEGHPYTYQELAFLCFGKGLSEGKAEEIIAKMRRDGEKDVLKADKTCLDVFLKNDSVEEYDWSWGLCKTVLAFMQRWGIPVEDFTQVIEKAL